jgi:acylphosphatase
VSSPAETDGRERIRVHCRISGRVQGVCFRMAARGTAQRLGLNGWVRNIPDGDVDTVAEGPADAVAQYLAWCRKGPPAARVTRVLQHDEPARGDVEGFSVRY